MIIAIALFGLNLAGAIATWRCIPKEQTPQVGIGPRFGPSYDEDADGNMRSDLGKLRTGERLVHVVKRRRPPTLVEIWSPVIASTSITLLVLLIPFGRSASRDRSPPSNLGGRPPPRLARVWFAARRATIAAALIGLNLAGAVYRPLLDPSEQRPADHVYFDGSLFLDKAGNFLFNRGDGKLLFRNADGSHERPATLEDFPLPLHHGDGRNRILDTIVYKSDGSIVDYEGNPGMMEPMLTWPRVIQPPTRSLLEMWWPAVASASITLMVLDVLWRQARRQRTDPDTEIEEQVDHADPT
ncbi:MAG: hypothetical protein ACHRXM_11500 [Isosphaerales bacterium]